MFTVNTKCILPHPVLQPYVRCFAVRSFDTGEMKFPKAMIADHEIIMIFFLRSKLFDFEPFNKSICPHIVTQDSQCCFSSILTSTKGFIIFKGPVTILNIHFKPVGFFHIFNIRPKELIDKMDDNQTILSNEIVLIHEQMQYAKTIGDSINIIQLYLIKKLTSQKPRYKHLGIVGASELLLQHHGLYPITKLASACNITLQTFEVQFEEQVGINPKYFSRLLRFGLAVNTKLYNPTNSWTDVAHSCGYFDQMHLIKEFKEFTELSPKNFMEAIHPPVENFI